MRFIRELIYEMGTEDFASRARFFICELWRVKRVGRL